MSDDLNSDARRLVDLAREARTPGEADKLRIAERLALPLAAGIAVGGAVSAAKAAAGAKAAGGALLGSWTAKVAAVIALGAAAGALVVSQRSPEPAPAAPSSLSAPAQPREVEPPAVVAAPSEPAPSEQPAPSDAAPSEPPTQSKRSGQSLALAPAHELAEEAALLHRAQAAWRAGQSAQALELANQHAQRFPRSQLGNERDVLRVLSLCKLGQARAAKQIGARLLQKAKGSPWYQSVAESCAGQ